MDFLTPQLFDILIIANILIGVSLAGRRLYKNITGPLPDDAPDWARQQVESKQSSSQSQDS